MKKGVYPQDTRQGGILPRVARGFSKTARLCGQFPRPIYMRINNSTSILKKGIKQTCDLLWVVPHIVKPAMRTYIARLRTENESQLFFFSILRFRTMSLRLSKLETVRVGDLAPSFSACNS